MPDGRLGEVIGVVSRSGALAVAVADRHDMSLSLLFAWWRRVRDGTRPGVVGAAA